MTFQWSVRWVDGLTPGTHLEVYGSQRQRGCELCPVFSLPLGWYVQSRVSSPPPRTMPCLLPPLVPRGHYASCLVRPSPICSGDQASYFFCISSHRSVSFSDHSRSLASLPPTACALSRCFFPVRTPNRLWLFVLSTLSHLPWPPYLMILPLL